jgi:excisionase family DNA binding protein
MTKTTSLPILGIPELAKYLGVSEMTIYRYAKAGKIPAFKVGAKWRFHKKSIDSWIAEKERYNVSGRDRRKSQMTLFDQTK